MQVISTIHQYEKWLELNPQDADALHALGVLLAKAEHYSEALDKIQQAIHIKANDASYYNSLGNIFQRLNQLDNAQKAYQKSIKINSSYAVAHNNLGNVFFKKSEFISAKKSYEKAIATKKNYGDAHANLGILLVKMEDDAAAIDALKKAISINSDSFSALNQLGDCFLRAKQYEQARDSFLQCISKKPGHAESQHRLGIAYFYLQIFFQAKAQFKHALSLNDRHPEANQYLANTHLQLRELDEALHHYFRQLDISPFFETYYNIGVLFMIKDRFKDALLYFDEALKINPDDINTYLNCGSIYLKSNQLEKAIACYEMAQKLNPTDDEIKHILYAIKQEQSPTQAPAAYINHLFDQYAPYYDHHLTARLEYIVPQKIIEAIQLEFPLTEFITTIDLGCGTGLCGTLLKPFSKKLIGIDLSENMLKMAREKKCYDELICGDIVESLQPFLGIDLITAADVFTYLGDLNSIFLSAKNALSKNGVFIFTVEKSNGQDFILQTSIRYAHSKRYIQSLCAQYHFDIIRFDNIVLRKQRNEEVPGYLVLLKYALC